jgi:hypothetical protein
MNINVIGIAGRASKGQSRPYLCEAADGFWYFSKSLGNVSPERLVVEYVVSRLAEECGLPVAPVRILEIPEELSAYSLLKGPGDFVAGPCFGSRLVPFAEELRVSHLSQVDEELRLRCLCFDWWVRNPDRRLDRLGDDPNLLWDAAEQTVALIDHDGALASDFDPAAYKREHAFRDARPFLDRKFLEKWRIKFESAIYRLDRIWAEMPEGWTQGVALTRQALESALIKPELPADGLLHA